MDLNLSCLYIAVFVNEYIIAIRPSIYFSSIVNQPVLSNKGKVSCSRKQQGAFDGSQTHDLHITSQTCNSLRHAAPINFSKYVNVLFIFSEFLKIRRQQKYYLFISRKSIVVLSQESSIYQTWLVLPNLLFPI